jgi:hypothetical protein
MKIHGKIFYRAVRDILKTVSLAFCEKKCWFFTKKSFKLQMPYPVHQEKIKETILLHL